MWIAFNVCESLRKVNKEQADKGQADEGPKEKAVS